MDTGGGDTSICKSTGSFDDQEWYHVVAVRKSTNDNCGLYITDINGNTVETIDQNYNFGTSQVDTDGKWYVGSNSDEGGEFFNGWIDDIIHWNGKALSNSPEAYDLARTNYGESAHKLNIIISKVDFLLGTTLSNVTAVLDLEVPFYDSQGNNFNDDSTYGVFNSTFALGDVEVTNVERLKYTVSFIPSTTTWTALELNLKVDDETITPTSSLLQTPPPDIPFTSYWTYDKSDRLEVSVYNLGPHGSWFVYQGTRAVFKSTDNGTSYAGIICSINSTESDPCSTGGGNDEWRIDEDRDSIFMPVDSIGKMYFWDIQNRPDRDVGGGSEIPAGEYDMFVFIDGYDEEGSTFLRNLQMGRVIVQD
ncbi:MAG: LamG domain-containing protein [Nanoarchaeota archaeon]|nr:LamG domain-containing protein [Nanoarchaeota archaeon]